MTASPFVPRSHAVKNRTGHQFIPGMGFLNCGGPPELPATAKGTKNCVPAPNTADGSAHLLQPPGGAKPMLMKWAAAEAAWAHPIPGKGNRMAWTTGHLSAAGWAYVGPSTAPKKSR